MKAPLPVDVVVVTTDAHEMILAAHVPLEASRPRLEEDSVYGQVAQAARCVR
jgi:hypothetical protein